MEDTVVLYPAPGRSHVVPLVELGKRILTHHPYFSITVIISHPPFEDAPTASYLATVTTAFPSVSLLHLPSLPLPPDLPKDKPTLYYEYFQLNNHNLRQALLDLSKSNPKMIKAFVMDFYCNAAFEVSTTFNIPTYYFLPGGASGLAGFLYSPTIDKLYSDKSLKDLDEVIHVPGLPSIPAYKMPTNLLDRNRKVYRYFIDTAIQMPKSAGIILNTFQALEDKAIRTILDGQCTPGQSAPCLYCLGPLIEANAGIQNEEEKHTCLTWLDSQPSQSVVFLSFGSMGKFSAEQLKEIAFGLETSGVRFLWVVRAPAPDDPTLCTIESKPDESKLESFLPDGFLERTKDRGMVVKSWAPQVAVLNHDSVGVFVTQSGWNSILEAICAGVPMLSWPLYADQKVNGAFLVEEIKVALPVGQSRDGSLSAGGLKEQLTEMMDSEKRREIRERMKNMRDRAMATWRENGPSLIALAKLAQSFKLESLQKK